MDINDSLIILAVAIVSGLATLAVGMTKRSRANAEVLNTGLNRKEWNLLRAAVLCAGECPDFPSKDFDCLPPHLKNHEVGQIIAQSLGGESGVDLEDAAKLLVGNMDDAWLALSKS